MPPNGESEKALHREFLTFDEILRLVSVFAQTGIRRVRLTGGEPLVRKDIVRLIELIRRQTPIKQLVMTTNATRLPTMARPLREAGLHGVNISIDTLNSERFRTLTRGGDLEHVLTGIRAAVNVGMEVKLNTVLLRGVNDQELGHIVDFAWSIGATPRFIELMPIGEGAKLSSTMHMSAPEAIAQLGARLHDKTAHPVTVQDQGPAQYMTGPSGHRIGFITPLSDDFCATCNRIRVTAHGDIRACLASRNAISLRDIIRTGADDLDIAWGILSALANKKAGHRFLVPDVNEHTKIGMSLIGG